MVSLHSSGHVHLLTGSQTKMTDAVTVIAAGGHREREVVLQEGADDGIQARLVPAARQAVLHLVCHVFGSGGLR